MKQLANQKPEDSPFASPLKKFPAAVSAAEQARIRTEMLDAIGKEVLPAYLRFVRFLEVSYVPAGRDKPGIDSIPDGAKYYGFLIREMTTTNLTAPQIHQIGLDEVQKDEAGMLAIAQKLGFQDLKSFRASLKDNTKLHPASGPALMDAYRKVLKPMQAKLPDYFGRLPKAPVEMAEVPDYMAKTSPPAYYQSGSPDGKRPGRLFVNTYDTAHRNLYSIESIAYHEGIPGHHLQISISQEQQGVPEFRKYGGYTAFVEGWASTRIPTPTTAASRTTSGAESGWSSIPASTPRAGPAIKWSSTSTTIPISMSPVCKPKWTAISGGRLRPSPTRLVSSRFWNCGRGHKKS
jgi:uncharacterized protein (DUF885 family)